MSSPGENAPRRIAILGASDRPDRYAHRAFVSLRESGHTPVPVHPRLGEIEGVPVVAGLGEIDGTIDTLTLYVNPGISEALAEEILALRPGRVIFNPGTESPKLAGMLEEAGIPTLEACTLVLLATGQF